MDEMTALANLAKDFEMSDMDQHQLRAVWDDEMAWEREWIRQRHKGTRGQYMLAVANTHDRLREWLRDGRLVPGDLEEYFLGRINIGQGTLTERLCQWVATTRRAPVWCSLWWVKKKLEERRGEGRNGHQENQTNSPATGGDLGRKHGQ